MLTPQICYFKYTCFLWFTDSQEEEGIHQKQIGSEKRQETEQEVCLVIEWKLRMEKEENKRQGQMQLVSNPPIKKKRTNMLSGAAHLRTFDWRLLVLRLPWWVRGWGEDGGLHRGYNLTTLDLVLFLCSLFILFFLFSFVLECSGEARAMPVSQTARTIFVVQFNIIQPNAKTTNKYEFHEAQWTLEHQRDFFFVRACNKLLTFD